MFLQQAIHDPLFYFSVVFTVVLSIIVHELCHGFAAIALGDRTPIHSGHMTADPLVHLGPWSILALAIAGIAWGQMPIDPTRLRGRFAEALVAFAGPASNFVLTILALTALGLWIHYSPNANPITGETLDPDDPFWENFRQFLLIFGATNFGLGLFNLLPVPPLDGSHILANFNRRYALFISDPGNGGVMLILFILAFGIGTVLFDRAVVWSIGYVQWLAS